MGMAYGYRAAPRQTLKEHLRFWPNLPENIPGQDPRNETPCMRPIGD